MVHIKKILKKKKNRESWNLRDKEQIAWSFCDTVKTS